MTTQQIIIQPVVTEKSADQEAEHNQYTFRVHRQANKIEIRKAVEMAFGVRVRSVRTQIVRGDAKRVGAHRGRTASWKKAVVTVHPEDSIDLYADE